MFCIRSWSVSINDRTIINSLSLMLAKGSTHILMGPNGSGKSTLAASIMGNVNLTCSGTLTLQDRLICQLSIVDRARAGIFLGFQHPLEIPGVSVGQLLIEAYQAVHGTAPLAMIKERIHKALELVHLHPSFIDRSVNVGFSGGEKKRMELAQMIVLKPALIILDEIDSGLDVQGLEMISRAIESVRTENPHAIVMLISHNTRIGSYVDVDNVHILKSGACIASGERALLQHIERNGYEAL